MAPKIQTKAKPKKAAAKAKAPAKKPSAPKKVARKDHGEVKLAQYIAAGCLKVDKTLAPLLRKFVSPDLKASELAYILVYLKDAQERWGETAKLMSDVLNKLKTELVPQAFEKEGISTFNMDEGFRVTISSKFAASIRPDQKEAAYAWLKANNLGDLIVETVNAGTLTAAGKQRIEEGFDLPEEFFNSVHLANTSVTKLKK